MDDQRTWTGPVNPEPDRRAFAHVRDTRACPDCGRPQHYTGTEMGWCHDALIDTWHCAGEHVRANKTSERGA